MRKVSGFTIVELVVVITILGILAAVALPKFFDVTLDAANAAAQGVAGAVSSASAINYGARLAKGSITGGVVSVTVCSTAVLGTLLTGGFPANFTVGGAFGAAAGNGAVNTNCTVTSTQTGATAQTITIIEVST